MKVMLVINITVLDNMTVKHKNISVNSNNIGRINSTNRVSSDNGHNNANTDSDNDNDSLMSVITSDEKSDNPTAPRSANEVALSPPYLIEAVLAPQAPGSLWNVSVGRLPFELCLALFLSVYLFMRKRGCFFYNWGWGEMI